MSEFGVFRDVLLDLFFAFGQRFRAFLTERKVEKIRLLRTDDTLYQLVKQYSQVFRGICMEWGDLEQLLLRLVGPSLTCATNSRKSRSGRLRYLGLSSLHTVDLPPGSQVRSSGQVEFACRGILHWMCKYYFVLSTTLIQKHNNLTRRSRLFVAGEEL